MYSYNICLLSTSLLECPCMTVANILRYVPILNSIRKDSTARNEITTVLMTRNAPNDTLSRKPTLVKVSVEHKRGYSNASLRPLYDSTTSSRHTCALKLHHPAKEKRHMRRTCLRDKQSIIGA